LENTQEKEEKIEKNTTPLSDSIENDDPYDEEHFFHLTKKNQKEYTEEGQKQEFLASYKKSFLLSLGRLGGCILLFLLIILLECGASWGMSLPSIFNVTAYPTVGLYWELQAVVLAIAILFPSYADGFKSLLLGAANAHSAFFVTTTITLLYYFLLLLSSSSEVNCFGITVLLTALLSAISDVLDVRREILSFQVMSFSGKKRALWRMNREQAKLEIHEVARYLPDDNKFLAIANTPKIDHFVAHTKENGKSTKGFGFLLAGATLLALAFGIYYWIRTGALDTALCVFYVAFLFVLPLSVYFLTSYPLYHLSVKAFEEDSAVVGQKAIYEMTEPATISLSDEDLFGKKSVHLVGVRTYGQMGMDKVLQIAAAVFGPAGGSLGKVLDDITESFDAIDDMEYLTLADDGVEAAVNGQHVLIGSYHYMMRNRLTIPFDRETNNGEDVFLYLSVDGEVSAKMRLQYIPKKNFGKALKSLFDSGTTAVLRTFDPSIDLSLISRLLNISERSPLKVIHVKDPKTLDQEKPSADSTVFTVGNISHLMNTLLRCSKARQAIKIGNVLAGFSVAISVIVLAVVLSFGNITEIPSIYMALYQLFWIIPPILVTKFFS
jgi:hypothetical protein